MQELKGLS